FGAFDPSATLSVDKPPLDLWLQVASVRLFGFSAHSLILPAAIAGTLAAPPRALALPRRLGDGAGVQRQAVRGAGAAAGPDPLLPGGHEGALPPPGGA